MEEINIKDFLLYLKKYIFIIVILTFLLVFMVTIYDNNFKVPLYKAYTTVVLAKSNEQSSTITQNDIVLNQKLVTTYTEIVKSELVLEQVIKNEKLSYNAEELSKKVSVEAIQDTEILKISVQDKNPKEASKIANSIAKVFNIEVSKIYKLDNISVIDKAKVPKEVCNDTFIRDIIISIFIGVFGSIAIIFIIYYFDDSIKLSDDLEEQIGMPVVAKIFKSDVKGIDKHSKVELILNKYPKALVSESVKTLRTNLQFSSIDNELKTILVTSSIPGEGKSFISANLALAFAQTGKRVLIVDCDMRKGRQHKIFDVSNSKGLSNLLIDNINNISEYVHKTSVKDVFLITRGMCPPNPSELLNSEKNKNLVNLLKNKFDIVIFDGVPCNGLPDSIIMSTLVDKVLIVSSDSMTPKNVLDTTIKSLQKVNAPIAGCVLNNVSTKNGKYGKYYNYYGSKEEK